MKSMHLHAGMIGPELWHDHHHEMKNGHLHVEMRNPCVQKMQKGLLYAEVGNVHLHV